MQEITGIGPGAAISHVRLEPSGALETGPMPNSRTPYQVYIAVLGGCHVSWKLLKNLSNLVDPNMTCLN